MIKIKVIKGPDKVGEKWKLKEDSFWTVGRSEDSDIRLSKGGVSKKHCSLKYLSDSEVEIEDLGSSNGTFVNGVLIKKHICVVGDVIRVSQYELKLSRDNPVLKMATRPEPNFGSSRPASGTTRLTVGNLALKQNVWNQNQEFQNQNLGVNASAGSTPSISNVATEPQDFGSRASRWIENNVYPVADSLAQNVNVRLLLLIFFSVWSIMMIALTAYPFMDKANQRVQRQAVEVARLYARQLVRLNQVAIRDQQYNALIASLDATSGQTPGLVDSMILDNLKAQVLAPADKLGSGVPNPIAAKAIATGKEFVFIEDTGIAHVGYPILIGTTEGNKAVATAYVMFNIERAVFNASTLLDQITSSLIVGLILGSFLLVFAFRWVEGSIRKITNSVSQSLRDLNSEIIVPSKWDVISELVSEISALQAKAASAQSSSGGAGMGSNTTPAAWLNEMALSLPMSAAVMDSDLKIQAWNNAMETLTGIREGQAIGSDISGASRDLAFETAIKDLCTEAQTQAGTFAKRDLDFSGVDHNIAVLFTGSQYLITIIKKGGV